jgi:hypothetical protein
MDRKGDAFGWTVEKVMHSGGGLICVDVHVGKGDAFGWTRCTWVSGPEGRRSDFNLFNSQHKSWHDQVFATLAPGQP